MYCPKCSQLQNSDQLRFCSRCGFGLETVRELLEDADGSDKAKSKSKEFFLRQKDISIGAGLMFAGGIVAVLWGFVLGSGPADAVISQAFSILGFALAFVLLFFHPLVGTLHKFFSEDKKTLKQLSKQQNGINLGAILMFIGILKAMLIASFMQAGSKAFMTIFMMTGGFLILLIVRWLVQTIYQLLFKGDVSQKDAASINTNSGITVQFNQSYNDAALPPAQSIPVSDYISPLREIKDVASQPSSVTEQTTRHLSSNKEDAK